MAVASETRRAEVYRVHLKERKENFTRITLITKEFTSEKEALKCWEQMVRDNERDGVTLNKIVELQHYNTNGRCATLKEKHI